MTRASRLGDDILDRRDELLLRSRPKPVTPQATQILPALFASVFVYYVLTKLG